MLEEGAGFRNVDDADQPILDDDEIEEQSLQHPNSVSETLIVIEGILESVTHGTESLPENVVHLFKFYTSNH